MSKGLGIENVKDYMPDRKGFLSDLEQVPVDRCVERKIFSFSLNEAIMIFHK